MPDETPKAPSLVSEPERPKAPPLPDAPVEVPGQHVVAAPSFNELEYDFKRQTRSENAAKFDQEQEVARGAKLSAAQQIDKDAEIRRTDKRLAAAEIGEQGHKKVAAPPLPDAPKVVVATAPPLPDAPQSSVAPESPQAEQSAPGDKTTPPQQNDLSAVMSELRAIHQLLEAMPRLVSQFGRLS